MVLAILCIISIPGWEQSLPSRAGSLPASDIRMEAKGDASELGHGSAQGGLPQGHSVCITNAWLTSFCRGNQRNGALPLSGMGNKTTRFPELRNWEELKPRAQGVRSLGTHCHLVVLWLRTIGPGTLKAPAASSRNVVLQAHAPRTISFSW